MKKVVVLTHYFSPCTLTPSQRITYWAKNLNRIGYYPIVVTRHWDSNIRSHKMTKLPFGIKIHVEKYDTYEVHYLPFKPGLLDWSYLKFGENMLRPLFLFSKVIDVLLLPFTLRHTSYWNYHKFLFSFFSRNGDVDKLIISGEPFYLFKIGYLISKKYGIKWLADYRDDWSTSAVEEGKGSGFFRKLIFKFESVFEKKWVGTAKAISSVSELYTNRISDLTKIQGVTIENGFEERLLDLKTLPLFSEFTIIYSGTLYPSQDLSILLDLLTKLQQMHILFKLIFLGTGFDSKERNRINSLVPDLLKPYVQVTDRLPRDEALIMLQKAHVLLGIAHTGLAGIPSSKLYEYLALGKPILLCPSDGDVMESMVTEAGLGFIANNPNEGVLQINRIKSMYKTPELVEEMKLKSQEKIGKFSRFEQMKKLLPVLAD
jgi:glycosyltransferase involved in cell wall biosynthesis